MSCCVVPSANIRVVEIPPTRAPGSPNVRLLLFFCRGPHLLVLLLVRWPIGDSHYNVTLTCILCNPNVELGNYVTKCPPKINQMLFSFLWSMLFIRLKETD